jgi:hypothetical protein
LEYYEYLRNAGLKTKEDAETHYLNHGQYENRLYYNKVKKGNKVEENLFKSICKSLTPFLPKEFPTINKNSIKKSLLVETRNLEHNEFVIKNTIQKLGDGWGHIIYCHKDNENQIRNICKDISNDIDIRLLDFQIDRNSYNNLCLDINFWNEIDCEKVLIYQTDTFILNKFDDEFLKYDYLGANWGPGSHMVFLKKELKIEEDLTNGNGGLSLRSVEVIKDSLKDENFKFKYFKYNFDNDLDKIPEDVYFSLWCFRNGNIMKDCSLFSIEHSMGHKETLNFDENPFGFHKIYNFDGWEFFIEKFKLNLKINNILKNIENFDNESYEVKKNHELKECGVSVIVTNFNYSKYIVNCVNSIRKNTLKDVEIVIVDDSSTDNSVDIINSLLKKNDINITAVLKKTNTHTSHSRNLGIDISIGDNIFVLDVDNEIYPTCLEKHLNFINKNKLDAAYGIVECFDEEDNFIREVSNKEYSLEELREGNYIDTMAMFKKSSILSIGGYSLDMIKNGLGWEDYELWVSLGRSGFKIGFINEKLSRYRSKKNGVLESQTKYFDKNLLEYINKKHYEN